MPRIRHLDNPDYAVDLMDGAKPIGSQFAVAAGFLTVLLIAMSVMETPMQPQEPTGSKAEATEMGEPSVPGPGPLCLIGTKVRDWISVAVS